MKKPFHHLLLACVLLSLALVTPALGAHQHRAQPRPTAAQGLPQDDQLLFVPLVTRNSPWHSPFGVQSDLPLNDTPELAATVGLKAGWVRLGPVSWRRLQPSEGGPVDWNQLRLFEDELRAVQQHGITPEVLIIDSPPWATINKPFVTSCGAIRSDKFGAFADFMRQMVQRYSAPEFDVHHWELGNEVDVDPTLVPANNGFGCWGNIKDPFYGGRQYGAMLKAVAPAIRAADPSAKIWFGGLLLDSPNTTEPNRGRPELFLQGALEAGAGPYFDILPYHAYTPYLNLLVDPDNPPGSQWHSLGGRVLGKARFLRTIMQAYGVDKPLFLNETALMCPDDYFPFKSWCSPPQDSFYAMQAIYLVRAFTRALAANVQGALWYSINGPGWRHTGLLAQGNTPTQAYRAFQVIGDQLQGSEFLNSISYGKGLEAYAFGRVDQQIHVIWAIDDQTLAITISQDRLIAAADRNGDPVAPIASGSNYVFLVGFEPLYLTLKP